MYYVFNYRVGWVMVIDAVSGFGLSNSNSNRIYLIMPLEIALIYFIPVIGQAEVHTGMSCHWLAASLGEGIF